MFKEVCLKLNLDYTRFHRDYYESIVKRGERINKEDLYYCFIESNLQLQECVEVFNVSYSKLRGDLFYYKIFKSPTQQQRNRERNCLEKHGVINPSCLKEVVEKRRKTNLERYGCINSSMDPEIKEKTRKTMNERFGGNAPACSKQVLEKIKQTNLERYGAEWQWQTEEGKRHREDICLEKYGVKNFASLPETKEKIRRTNLERYGRENVGQFGTEEYKNIIRERYGVEYIMQNKEIKQRIKKTNLERYGVENIFQLPEIKQKAREAFFKKYGTQNVCDVEEFREKANEGRARWRQSPEYPEKRKLMTEHNWETRRRNGTYNTSKTENKIFELLKQKFVDVKREYKSELYPFHCDFYIPSLDLYIEYQGDWSHGSKGNIVYGSFNKDNVNHIKILNEWKESSKRIANEKNTVGKRNRYTNAIEVWTIRDPLKRETARKNNLNWIEFFTMDEFMKWYDTI